MFGSKSPPRTPWLPNSVRTGITLFELLVVLAILGVLIAISMPAIQSLRESVRQVKCKANLKQLGLATANFELTHHVFPGGGWGYQWQGYSDIESTLGQPGSWTYSLLPYIEHSSLYEMARYGQVAVVRDRQLRERNLHTPSIYMCPSRRSSSPKAFDPSCATCDEPIGALLPLEGTGRGDYAVNAGDGAPAMEAISHWPSDFWGPADLTEARRLTRQHAWPPAPADWSGISWLRASVSLAEVMDGSSHVILMGEKYVSRDRYASGTDWGDNEPLYCGFDNDNHRSTHPEWPLLRDEYQRMSIGSFGSAHASGANFVMVDGSVRVISYSADVALYRSLGNRFDGNRRSGQ